MASAFLLSLSCYAAGLNAALVEQRIVRHVLDAPANAGGLVPDDGPAPYCGDRAILLFLPYP